MATAMTEEKRKVRLGILFGGKSGEHEVSLASAAAVIAALDPGEFEVVPIGISRSGRLAERDELRSMLPAALWERVGLSGSDGIVTPTFAAGLLTADDSHARPDIVFPLLHGPYGEDGTMQGLLEITGLPYVGCGVLASAVGMDKDVMKRLFLQAALPVVPWRVALSRDLKSRLPDLRAEIEQAFGYPVFSKPANLGSSVGIFKIRNGKEFNEAVLASARFDRKVVIEKGIDARELECAVLGNDDAEASVVGEIVPAGEFYDYDAKYKNPASSLSIPAGISAEASEEIRTLALRAFKAIDGAGLARVDFFLDRATGKIWLNEINTMPGFTPISMYPKLWAACGIPFDQLIRRLMDLARERHDERAGTGTLLTAMKGG